MSFDWALPANNGTRSRRFDCWAADSVSAGHSLSGAVAVADQTVPVVVSVSVDQVVPQGASLHLPVAATHVWYPPLRPPLEVLSHCAPLSEAASDAVVWFVVGLVVGVADRR